MNKQEIPQLREVKFLFSSYHPAGGTVAALPQGSLLMLGPHSTVKALISSAAGNDIKMQEEQVEKSVQKR